MDKINKEALQTTKELTCKFIEARMVSPANFAEIFPVIFKIVADTVNNYQQNEDAGGNLDS